MKNTFVIILCCLTGLLYGQIESVDYLMKYNCETNQYDVKIVIMEGSANSIQTRVQLNSQISIVVPTGEAIVITNKYMPLQSNQHYSGSAPLDWTLANPIYAPASQPENDFYSVIPKLSPASFYNDMEEGDVITLFSFVSGATGQYNEGVRFYQNDVDPSYADVGMNGGDFSNGFTIGGSENIYNSNSSESCSITKVNEILNASIDAYPNPFNDHFTIDLPIDAKTITVIGSDGRVYYNAKNKSKGILTVNSIDFPNGIYYIRLETVNGTSIKKLAKF